MRTKAEGEGSARGGFPLFRRAGGGRLWRYGPVVVWIGVIFFASTSGFSASNTSRIIRPLLLWLFPDIDEPTLAAVHLFVRKAAHFIEYAVLALLAARAFLTSSRRGLRRRWPAAAFALVAACSLLDEFHQSFLAARAGTVYDSLLDMSGGAAALALLAALRRARVGM
nr:VanZ family protein [Acidobacteriota bacterium]